MTSNLKTTVTESKSGVEAPPLTTPEERKAAYENSAMRQLMESQGHTICKRCYCCDEMWESAPCWQCGGFEEEEEDGFPPDVCSVCCGEGDIDIQVCAGDCDENGNHKKVSHD